MAVFLSVHLSAEFITALYTMRLWITKVLYFRRKCCIWRTT